MTMSLSSVAFATEARHPRAGFGGGSPMLARIARTIAATPGRWQSLVRYDESERWYTRLRATDDYEVWLLSWLPGQGTGVHDHGGSAGALAVAQGQLDETVFTRQPVNLGGPARVTESTQRYAPGQVRPFGSRHTHNVANNTDLPAVSVHVYAPALHRMNRYAVEGDLLRLVVSERAGADW